MPKVNILGSCISRLSMLDGDKAGHNIADKDISMDYFLDKQNIVCAMTSAPFSREEVETIKEEELWDKTRLKSLKQCLTKDTVKMLLESDAEYLVMDLFDMQNDFAIYGKTMFSTCAHEFFNTALCKKYANGIELANFMGLPKWAWYGYVDLFFEKIMQKYDSNHIILNRFRSSTYYLTKNGDIALIPNDYKKPFHSNDKYNKTLTELEQHIIDKYNPYVVDLSKYFMVDENFWDNFNGAHFEKAFYEETFNQVKRIIKGETKEKYFSNPDFFNEEHTKKELEKPRGFNVDGAIKLFEELVEKQDLLWINILDKLNIYAPDNEKVKQYMEFLGNTM
ncbi:MAG: hypothetical protein IJS47_00395 [Clostridia bacterium]|nr:hypothetical protein [Clostridia bacterium]